MQLLDFILWVSGNSIQQDSPLCHLERIVEESSRKMLLPSSALLLKEGDECVINTYRGGNPALHKAHFDQVVAKIGRPDASNTSVFKIKGHSYSVHKIQSRYEEYGYLLFAYPLQTKLDTLFKKHCQLLTEVVASQIQREQLCDRFIHVKEFGGTDFKGILEEANDAILILNPQDETILFANKAACELYDCPPHDFVGHSMKEFTLIQLERQALYQQLMHHKRLKDVHARHITRKGRVVDILFSVSLIEYNNNVAALSVNRNITQKLLTEKKLLENEQFLDAIVENLPHMVFLKEADHLTFIKINKAGEELLGISNEEIRGKSDFDFFPYEEAAHFGIYDRAVLRGEKVIVIEDEPIHTRFNGVRYLRTKKIPLRNVNGKSYILGISEDITEEKKAQEKIQSQAEFLESLNASIPGVIFRCKVDPRQEVTIPYMSEGFDKICGVNTRQFLQDWRWEYTTKKYIHRQDLNSFLISVRKSYRQLNPWILEFRFKHADGTSRWVLGSCKPEKQPDGAIIWSGMLTDITAFKKTENAALRAMHVREKFLSLITHEIKTPLNAIVGFEQALKPSVKKQIDARHLQEFKDSTLYLSRLFTNILYYTDLVSKDYQPLVTNIDLRDLVEQVCFEFNHRIKKSGLKIKTSFHYQVPAHLKTHKIVIQDILACLLDNATKFTPAGHIEVRLSVNDGERDELLIEVEDTGVGISKRHLNKIFEPFFTSSAFLKRRHGGTGLGLAIVKQLIDLIEGNITVESEPGKGTLFTVSIPLLENINATPRIHYVNFYETNHFLFRELYLPKTCAFYGYRSVQEISSVLPGDGDLLIIDVDIFDLKKDEISWINKKFKKVTVLTPAGIGMETELPKNWLLIAKPISSKSLVGLV